MIKTEVIGFLFFSYASSSINLRSISPFGWFCIQRVIECSKFYELLRPVVRLLALGKKWRCYFSTPKRPWLSPLPKLKFILAWRLPQYCRCKSGIPFAPSFDATAALHQEYVSTLWWRLIMCCVNKTTSCWWSHRIICLVTLQPRSKLVGWEKLRAF